jgi:outer membrane PBP1 activator LpoA protein
MQCIAIFQYMYSLVSYTVYHYHHVLIYATYAACNMRVLYNAYYTIHQEFVAEKQQLQLELVQSQETEKESRRKLTAIYSAREKKLKQQSKAEIDQLKAELAETTKLVKQLTQQQQQKKLQSKVSV